MHCHPHDKPAEPKLGGGTTAATGICRPPPQPLLYEENLLSARMMHFVDDRQLAEAERPFANDPHQNVFVSRCVVEDNAPIVRVVHDRQGDWEFIGPVDDPDEDGCKLRCFHCVVERDKSIRTLTRLLPGWRASRNGRGDDWVLCENDETDEPE